MRFLFRTKFDQTQTRSLVKNHYEQNAANNAYVDTFPVALVGQRGKLSLADQLCHSTRGRNIARRQRRETCCVQVSQVSVDGDLLTILIDEHNQPRRGIKPQAGQNSFNLMITLLAY